jgi:tetratricopeptide (TPR) repeat protein
VDSRSDVWSLGLVLAEALGGGPAGSARGAARAAGDLRQLPVGLRDILQRALQQDPAARYPSAAALAEDLRRHLTDRPLVGVRNRGLRERWAKWRRRRPHALVMGALLLAVVAVALTLASLAIGYARQRTHEAEQALQVGVRHLSRRQYAEAAAVLEHGRTLTENVPGTAALAEQLLQQERRAVRGRAARALHATVERLRYHYGDMSLTPSTLRTLEAQCASAWASRFSLLKGFEASLEADEEEQLHADLLDVAVLWADFRTRGARPQDLGVARREALKLLTEAQTLFGSSAVVAREQQALGGPVGATEPGPRTAWEHYAVGRWLLRAGDLNGAAAALGLAVALQPRDFWPWFYSGLAAFRQKRLDDSVTAFTVCIALNPASAECYYNRGLAQAARGQAGLARTDYDRALELDQTLAAALLNRGVLHLRENHLADAADDLTRALSLGADAALAHYNLALVCKARRDQSAALTHVEEVLRRQPDHSEARALRQRLLSTRP